MHGLPLVIKQLSNSNSGVQRAAIRLLSVLFPNGFPRQTYNEHSKHAAGIHGLRAGEKRGCGLNTLELYVAHRDF